MKQKTNYSKYIFIINILILLELSLLLGFILYYFYNIREFKKWVLNKYNNFEINNIKKLIPNGYDIVIKELSERENSDEWKKIIKDLKDILSNRNKMNVTDIMTNLSKKNLITEEQKKIIEDTLKKIYVKK
jgi:hypothetical protein